MLLIAMQQQTKVHFLQQTILLKTAHEAVHSALHHQVRYVQMPILATLVSSKVAKFGNR